MPNMDAERQFEEALEHYRNIRNSGGQELIVELMRETQELFGCVTVERQGQIARAMDTTPAVIAAIIKRFPSLKGEAFRYRVTVCTGPRCSQKGAAEILRAAKEALGINPGEATRDGLFLLDTQNCLKKCGTAPNLRVGNDYYPRVSPEDVARILQSYRK